MLVLHVGVLLKYHQAAFSFQILEQAGIGSEEPLNVAAEDGRIVIIPSEDG